MGGDTLNKRADTQVRPYGEIQRPIGRGVGEDLCVCPVR